MSKDAKTASPGEVEIDIFPVVSGDTEAPRSRSTTLRPPATTPWKERYQSFILHVKKHAGLGIVCAVASFNPGNWAVNLQAGSQYGFRLLFVVLSAGVFAILFQTMAYRMGCVTGLDLATHCRLLSQSRHKHAKLWRLIVLYPLYAISECATIATELAEIIGSAIALCLLFPHLELWHAVIISSFDVVILLLLGNPLGGKPLKVFEVLLGLLALVVMICLCVLVAHVESDWVRVFQGFLPSKYIAADGAAYLSVGIIGATVLPHSIFLASALGTQERVDTRILPDGGDEESFYSCNDYIDEKSFGHFVRCIPRRMIRFMKHALRAPPPSPHSTLATRHSEVENNSYMFVRAHLIHGVVDIVIGILGAAVVINSLILILAGGVFYFGGNPTDPKAHHAASLFDAYDIIREVLGKGPAIVYAIGLLAAGQSSSIVVAVAGQVVSGGFLQWQISPIIRKMVTRLVAAAPAVAVARVLGKEGLNDLLVVSQVILSILLPLITLPLIYITSKKVLMAVRIDTEPSLRGGEASNNDNFKDYSNHPVLTGLACAVWMVVTTANIYVLIQVASH